MSKEREGGDWTLLRGNLVTIQFSRHRYELNTASAVSTNAIDFDTMIQCYHFFLSIMSMVNISVAKVNLHNILNACLFTITFSQVRSASHPDIEARGRQIVDRRKEKEVSNR